MLGANLSPAEKTSVLAAAEAAVNQAILANRFDAASRITRLASPEAQKSGSGKTWEAISAKIQSLSRGYAEAAAASKILQQKPDDPAANFSVGSYLCFEKGQWTAGLPFLARGNDTEARDMALRDLAGAADANAQSALGDAWWDLAKKRTTKAGEIERRAAFWYRQAGPGLSGLARAKVEMRVKEADSIANAADSNPGDHEVNLLALFAHHSKQISGQWEMSSEGLSCAKGGQLLFEYSPPEEYDLQIEFTQRTGRDSFAIICPLSQGSVEWMAGGWGNHVMGFVHLADGGWHALTSRNVDGVLKDGKRNTATIRVRRGSAQAIFNGALVSELPGDGKGFSVGENTINGKPVVGLSIDGYTSAIIYKMQIVEVTGSHGVSAERAGEPLASLQFVENMGYTIGELRKGNSTHNNDDYPLTEVPAAMIGKPFTKFVAGKPGSVSFKFTTSGKIFILAVEWPGYPSQAAVLKHIAKKEPMRVVGSKETFEVWSITAEAGKRIDLPFQEILVADHLEKVAKLDDR
ncbi:MAG TPA: hypothetical protein VFE47_14295 [Tepidisphaeraceae bacterium]|nr:hypothetical protein [Tepidisphaeraceae bacterium]